MGTSCFDAGWKVGRKVAHTAPTRKIARKMFGGLRSLVRASLTRMRRSMSMRWVVQGSSPDSKDCLGLKGEGRCLAVGAPADVVAAIATVLEALWGGGFKACLLPVRLPLVTHQQNEPPKSSPRRSDQAEQQARMQTEDRGVLAVRLVQLDREAMVLQRLDGDIELRHDQERHRPPVVQRQTLHHAVLPDPAGGSQDPPCVPLKAQCPRRRLALHPWRPAAARVSTATGIAAGSPSAARAERIALALMLGRVRVSPRRATARRPTRRGRAAAGVVGQVLAPRGLPVVEPRSLKGGRDGVGGHARGPAAHDAPADAGVGRFAGPRGGGGRRAGEWSSARKPSGGSRRVTSAYGLTCRTEYGYTCRGGLRC
ncbi:hypothetical protein SAMN05216499_1486 [Actinacidiphila paucisporea]|uniref:Uncharacterized protein n=1 Tax=Actinacidiphila paucisporea TaxID=310782 RepID=A0A1M7QXF0_9ACTN|nr:hypothetical protein SAMN05216499_1486 [Actinacidiphila paucisporea]